MSARRHSAAIIATINDDNNDEERRPPIPNETLAAVLSFQTRAALQCRTRPVSRRFRALIARHFDGEDAGGDADDTDAELAEAPKPPFHITAAAAVHIDERLRVGVPIGGGWPWSSGGCRKKALSTKLGTYLLW